MLQEQNRRRLSGLRGGDGVRLAPLAAVLVVCKLIVMMQPGTTFRTPRRAERLRFETPVAALFGSQPVVMSDLSTAGAGIIHREQLGRETSHPLSFTWDGVRLELIATVTRSTFERKQHAGVALTAYHSGLSFSEDVSSAAAGALSARLTEALARQKANAFAISIETARDLPLLEFDVEEPRVAMNLNEFFVTESRAQAFVQCRLVHGCWVHERVDTPAQPADGFTISAAERVEDLERLCRTYQKSDKEGRNLIRTFAHLTLVEPPAIPPDLYTP